MDDFSSERALGICDDIHFIRKAHHLGIHGFRKGLTIDAMSGTTAPPPLSSVARREEWSQGVVVFDVYLQFAEPGDQFLGRILAGLLDPNSAEFAVLPPYFTVGPKENADVAQALKISSGKIGKQHKATGLLMFCLASMIFHIEFIRDHNAAKNPSHDFNKLPILQMPALVK